MRHPQRGSSLFEALIAFLVLSLGMIGLARLQGQQRADADAARDRTEAVRLAQGEMESVRGLRPLTTAVSTTHSVSRGTAYRVDRTIAPLDAPQSVAATISVSWTDRRGAEQRLALESIIVESQPALSGALLAEGAR